MKASVSRLVVVAPAVLVLGACTSMNSNVRHEISQDQPRIQKTLSATMHLRPESRVLEMKGKIVPVTVVTDDKASQWLSAIFVDLDITKPTPLSAVVEKLAAQGVNVSSDLPLDSYVYTGRVNKTGADAALKTILGSVGLDYETDDVRKLVIIKPMSSRSWFLNIGKRQSSFSSDGSAASTSSSSGSSSSGASAASGVSTPSNISGGVTGTTAPMGGASGSATPTGTAMMSGGGSQIGGTATVSSADDFWSSLAKELNKRLTVMVPRESGGSLMPSPGMPVLPQTGFGMRPSLPIMPGMPGGGGLPNGEQGGASRQTNSNGLYVSRKIGTYSLNPETGAITVQAPHWILNGLDQYFKRVQEMYNTDISFVGEVVLVTGNRSDSEGVDLSAFASWAGSKYSAIIANNALGGVTVSLPSASSALSVTAGAQTVGGALMGLRYQGAQNAMQIFNAFLSQLGNVSVIQRPMITTTSGVPGVFSKKFTDYYNTVSQQAAAGGTGSAATATQNTLVPVQLGTELKINPRIDISTGLIRAQLSLDQSIQSGTRVIPQTITFGNNTTTINTSIPLVTQQDLSGEVLLRDGDLIVVGGQTENNLSNNANGLPGQDGPLSGLFGVKTATRETQTYYFALRVSVKKRK